MKKRTVSNSIAENRDLQVKKYVQKLISERKRTRYSLDGQMNILACKHFRFFLF